MTDFEKTIAGLSVVKARMEFHRHASAKVVGDALELLKEQQEQKEKWIPVEKELPNEGKIVLVATPAYTDDDGEEYVEGVQCAYWLFRSHTWFSSDGVTYGNGEMLKVNPTHWMPLPEKP